MATGCPIHPHGMSKAKGCDHAALGHFDKLFPKLDGVEVSEAQARALGGVDSPMHDVDRSSPDGPIPAGYAFFGQLVDHDITLDTTTELHGKPLDLKAIQELPNLRSPTLDLDCVYGFGPDASPHLYSDTAPGRLLVGNHRNPDDLPRNEVGRALIGDPRNDENLFVSQLQLLFLRFHNKVLDSLRGDKTIVPGDRFETAQTKVRHHYQYIVLHDWLQRVCHPDIYAWALAELAKNEPDKKKYPKIYRADAHDKLPMPVEFSVAAYRFGHSLVRSEYAVNGDHPSVDLFDQRFGTEGFSAVPTDLVVDWKLLFEVDPCVQPLCCKAIDLQLADELVRMPDPIVGRLASDEERSLAFRNLLRGHALSLASGQEIKTALTAAGYPLPNTSLQLGKVLPKGTGTALQKNTPLFFYLLREAEVIGGGKTLGPVGSAILLEVFLGILQHCQSTFLFVPDWAPDPCIAGEHGLQLADIVRYVEGS